MYKFRNNLLIEEYIESNVLNELVSQNYNLVICCNIEVLPIAIKLKRGNTRILFDIREYFLMHFSSFLWKILIKPRNVFIFTKYLKYADKAITVSNGLKKLYKDNLNLDCEVYMSLPTKSKLKSEIKNKYDKIRIVHHGVSNPTRKIENMIYLMDYLDKDKYNLDLYLVNLNNSYFNKLLKLADERKNVNILEPVKFNEINNMLSEYDIGLYLLEDISLNHKFALPNKIFEFIQSGLCLAFSPSPDMKYIIDKFDLGVTADNYDPKNLADKIRNLSDEDINKYKDNSRKASEMLNAETNNKRMNEIIEELLN